MKTKFNRFAILPRMCNSCNEFVWLEPYRRSDVFHFPRGGYSKENICKRCIGKYNVGAKENEHEQKE